MALVVAITQVPAGPVENGTSVKLKATATPPSPAPTFTWTKADGAAAAGDTIDVTATQETKGAYKVVGKTNGDQAEASHTLEVKGSATSPEPQIVWRADICIPAAGVLVLLFGFALWSPLGAIGDFEWSNDTIPAGNRAVDTGGVIGLVLLVLGGIALAIGLWMAIVELAGRFRTGTDGVVAKGAGDDAAKVIEAIGKLKGVALVLVIACIPLLAAAWVASHAVDQPPPTTTTAPPVGTVPSSTTVP